MIELVDKNEFKDGIFEMQVNKEKVNRNVKEYIEYIHDEKLWMKEDFFVALEMFFERISFFSENSESYLEMFEWYLIAVERRKVDWIRTWRLIEYFLEDLKKNINNITRVNLKINIIKTFYRITQCLLNEKDKDNVYIKESIKNCESLLKENKRNLKRICTGKAELYYYLLINEEEIKEKEKENKFFINEPIGYENEQNSFSFINNYKCTNFTQVTKVVNNLYNVQTDKNLNIKKESKENSKKKQEKLDNKNVTKDIIKNVEYIIKNPKENSNNNINISDISSKIINDSNTIFPINEIKSLSSKSTVTLEIKKSTSKSWSECHFTKDSFAQAYFQNNNIDENKLIKKLTYIADNHYEHNINQTEITFLLSYPIDDKITEKYFKYDNDYYCIAEQKIKTNIEERNTLKTLLFYDPQQNFTSRTIDKVNFAHRVQEIYRIYKSSFINYDRSINYEVLNDQHQNSKLLLVIQHQNDFSVHLNKLCNKFMIPQIILDSIFKVDSNLLKLFTFFYRISVKFDIIKNPFELFSLIISFLDVEKHLFEGSRMNTHYYDLYISEIVNGMKTFSHKQNNKVRYFDINQMKLNNIFQMRTGELIIDFYRFFINFLEFRKIERAKSLKQDVNYLRKGYKELEKMFDSQHLFNHSYLFNLNFLSMKDVEQKDFNIVSRVINEFTQLFFKICQNYDIINDYSTIIENIKY